MLLVEEQNTEEFLNRRLSRIERFRFDFPFEVSASELPFLLYELNGWIGGPGDRILILQRLTGFQPSFDGLWSKILLGSESELKIPAIVRFEEFDYQNLDQLSESKKQAQEVQCILGCLAISVAGGCSTSVFSNSSRNMVEIGDELSTLYSDSEAGIRSGIEILSKYGII